MNRLEIAPIAALLSVGILLAGIPSPAAEPANALPDIQEKVARVLRQPGIRSTRWGIEIADSDRGVLFSVNPNRPFLPASVLKVITTAAAMEKLGPEHRFRTGVYTDSIVRPDGNLAGNLYLVGRGDPNLLDAYGELSMRSALEELAEQLWNAGLRRISGDVVGDDSYFHFGSFGKGWTYEDLRSPHGAPISALSVHNNAFVLSSAATTPKHLVAAWMQPANSYFRIRNLATTGSARARRTISARLIPGTRTVVISGVLPAGRTYTRHILVERPAEAAAAMLAAELAKLGVKVEGRPEALHSGDMPGEFKRSWTLLAEHLSPPLIRAVEIINKHSQNLHAEMLLRTLGAEFRGRGSDEAGLEVVRDFLVGAGVDLGGVQLKDGCGLSRENLLTPHFQTSLLLALAGRPYYELFLNSLAVSGTDGTLRGRLASEPVRGSVFAKTGSLSGVSTLSGYMTTRSGRSLAFSIFANNAAASMKRIQRAIDEICSLFVNLY